MAYEKVNLSGGTASEHMENSTVALRTTCDGEVSRKHRDDGVLGVKNTNGGG